MKIEYKLNKKGFLKGIIDLNQKQIDNCIDISEIKFADIFGIVSMTLLLKKEFNNCNKMSVIMPRNLDVSNYLHISGFVDYIKKFANVKYNGLNIISKLHSVPNISDDKEYIPLQVIHNNDDVELIIEKIISWLKNKNIPEDEISKIFTVLVEIFQNAIDHSNSRDGCIFAMQKYQSELMISIADFGIGIKEALAKNKKYVGVFKNNEETMKYIFTEKNYINSENDKFRGNGFYCLNNLSTERKMNFFIISRDGFYSSEYIRGKNQRESMKIYDLEGTHVNFCINL